MDRCSIINDRTSLHNVWPTSSSPFSSSPRFVHFRLFFRGILFSYLIRIFVHTESATAFLHFTRACLRLIGNKIRKGESYVYASFIYIYIYTGESSNESNNIYFGLITLFRFRSFIRVCNVEREGAFGNSSFEIYKSWKFGIYFMD